MLNQESTQVEVPPKPATGNHNPLNDHDYCSPNKRNSSTKQASSSQAQNMQSNNKSSEHSDVQLESTTATKNLSASHLNDPECPVTSSSNLIDQQKRSDQAGNTSPRNVPSKIHMNQNVEDGLSDSSSSISSDGSGKGLVIAQDSYRSLAPKDTPSVSRKSKAHKEISNPQTSAQQARAKRPRQNTSVTDKSQWIMGDDQIDSVLSEHLVDEPKEKRNRTTKKLDPEFETFSPSDGSSSDADFDAGSEGYNSEDDPNQLWCSCLKPYDDKFMICCDICEYWYHGHCVGVTKLMGDRFDREKTEWHCQECKDKIASGIPRSSIPKKVPPKAKKQKKHAQPIPGKRGRGRPRKSETLARDEPARMSLRNTRKSSTSIDSKLGLDNGRLKNRAGKSDARSESFYEFSNAENLKQLIRERKREFFYKRSLAEQQKALKRDELGLGRQSLTALSDSLDSLASSTSTPNMSNLPTNIKSGLKDRSKIVLQINTKKDPSADSNDPNSRIVTAIVKSPKKKQQPEPIKSTVDALFTTDPIQISKKAKVEIHDEPTSSTGDNSTRRLSSGSNSAKGDKSGNVDHSKDSTTPKKKRKDSESSGTPNGSTSNKQFGQKIKEILELRCKQIKDLDIKPDKIESLATEIEHQLNENFREGTNKHSNKFRSLLFNLKDTKNEALVSNVLTDKIPPARLVKMTPDEMAPHELAKWRERENKHSIELIKRDAQLAAQQVIVKKTHKGEEVISAPTITDPEDPTAVVNNQEPPTTPTQAPSKEPHSPTLQKASSSPPNSSPSVSKSTGGLKMKISGISSDFCTKTSSETQASTPVTPMEESIAFLDTTNDHKNHFYDMNCRVCTDRPIEEPANSNQPKASENSESEIKKLNVPQQSQPKRFRVSIDTKIDPTNLSRLKEPLIKPSQPSTSAQEADGVNQFSPNHEIEDSVESKTPPQENDEDEIDYDPEVSTALPEKTATTSRPLDPNEPVWSGVIAMPDIPKFSAFAKPVSGTVDFMRDEINKNLMVCGRIAPDQVQTYIKKLKATTKNQVLLIQLNPLTEDDKSNYNNFFDHLYSRNRCGVVEVPQQVLKDFYIIPIHEKSNIPEAYKPIKGPGLDRKTQPNILLGLLVRTKRASPTLSGYTPTPVK